ncbi:hypothetical protein [uncultured Parolsenella sp.]|uniref:hypothetical protein n=1 Tax=uncultured Parolsenella sp. TaxID=2083008 RepID=UPI0025FCB9F5|nr:hypothetical protein [uncultured Parolsenella sp.]
MARFSDIPFSRVRDVAEGARASEARRRSCVRVAIELEEGAPDDLAYALRDALMPETASGLVHVGRVRKGAVLRVSPDCDLAIVVAGTSGAAAGVARAFSRVGVPCAVVVETSVEAPELAGTPGVALVSAASPEVLLPKLASWMADSCRADVALAANFPLCRRAVAERCIRERSAQGAAVGLLPLSGGADMPVLAAGQTLMALDLAGAYGHGPSADRLADVAAVIFAGLASRAVARRVSRVLPGLGWLVRGAVAYGGTAAIGWALVCRHEVQDFVERGRLQPPAWVAAASHHGKHVNEGHISH